MSFWQQLRYILVGLPDWIVWRIEAWALRIIDLNLSPLVREALKEGGK